MAADVQVTDGVVEVTLSGKVYAEEASVIREQVFPLIGEGHCFFHFRMHDLVYMDSSGLGMLLALQKRAAKLGGEVRISGLQGDLLRLFELTKLTALFRVKDH